MAQEIWRDAGHRFVTVVKETQRLRELEKENAGYPLVGVKRILAERDLKIDCLKEVNSKNF